MSAVLGVNVLHLHGERGADPREGIDHQSDERPIAEPLRRPSGARAARGSGDRHNQKLARRRDPVDPAVSCPAT